MPVIKPSESSGGILDRIKKVSDFKIYTKSIAYADPGTGKTWLAGTMPGKTLMLLTEPEVSKPTLAALRKAKGFNPETLDIKSWDDVGEIYQVLYNGDHDFNSLAIDSLTDLVRRCIEAVLGRAIDKKNLHDEDLLEISDWNRVRERMGNMIRAFRDLPMDVIMTARVLEIRSEMRLVPDLSPKSLAGGIISQFNMGGFYKAVENSDDTITRKWLLCGTDKYDGKNPGGALPEIVDDPDMSVLIPQVKKYLMDIEEVFMATLPAKGKK